MVGLGFIYVFFGFLHALRRFEREIAILSATDLVASLQLFSQCILVTLACHLGEDFTPIAHAAMDKFLSAFAAVLAEKYR